MTLLKNKTGGQLLYSIGIFALAGVSLGVIGFVVLSQLSGGSTMTDAIFSGIFSIIILVIALFLGPVIATIVGIQIANRNQSFSVYLISFISNTIGYIVMMITVIVILSIGVVLVSNGGGSGAMGGANGDMGTPGGSGLGQWIFPIIAISMIAGLTGTGASYLQIQANQTGRTEAGSLPSSIPTKGILTVLLVGGVLLGGIYGASTLFSGDPSSNLEVNGDAYSQQGSLYGEATIENLGDSEATATLTIQLVLNSQVHDDFTSSTEIIVGAGGFTTETLEIGHYSNLSQSEMDALRSGNWEVEFLINGEVKDTDTE